MLFNNNTDSKKNEISRFGLCRCPSAKFFFDNYSYDERAYLWATSDMWDKEHMNELGVFGYEYDDWKDVW